MTDNEQAQLLERYRLALQKNMDSQPPHGLDAELAQFMRQLVISQQASHLDYIARSRIWEQALNSLDNKEQPLMIYAKQSSQPQFLSVWGVVIGLFLLVGVVMMINLNNHSPNNYLSVYPLATQTEIPTEPALNTEPIFETASITLVPDSSHQSFEATGTAFVLQPTVVEPIATYIPSAGYPFLFPDDAQLKDEYCAGYADFESSECLYRIGVSLFLSKWDEDLTRGVGYLRDAYALAPDNDLYRYTLASGLLKLNDCVESHQLLMMEESNKSIHLNTLAEYVSVCEETMTFPSGLMVIVPPTVVPASDLVGELDFGDLCMNVSETSAECFYLKGLFVYWMNGRDYSAEALAYFGQASAYNPESLEYRYQLVLGLAETGQCEASKRLLLATQDIDDGVVPVIEHFNEYCGVLEIPDGWTMIDRSQYLPTVESTPTPMMTATPTLTPTPTPIMMSMATSTPFSPDDNAE